MADTMSDRLAGDAIRDAVTELEGRQDYAGQTFTHADGSVTVIMHDDDASYANPRDNDGNIATLVQVSRDYVAVDEDVAGVGDVWDRIDGRHGWRDGDVMRRYLAIFRPDILHFDTWDTGTGSRGYGYVTVASWHAAMGEDYAGEVTPEDAMRSEVDVYAQWCRGEVYGAVHLTLGAPVVAYGPEGAYVDGYTVDEDSCWGFLGYEELADIAGQFTDSPVVNR